MLDLESAIRDRAYHIWQAEGEVQGRELDHWLRAEAETTAALMPPAQPTESATKQADKPAAKPRRTPAKAAAKPAAKAKPVTKAKTKA